MCSQTVTLSVIEALAAFVAFDAVQRRSLDVATHYYIFLSASLYVSKRGAY